jgi:hypothetical protein
MDIIEATSQEGWGYRAVVEHLSSALPKPWVWSPTLPKTKQKNQKEKKVKRIDLLEESMTILVLTYG